MYRTRPHLGSSGSDTNDRAARAELDQIRNDLELVLVHVGMHDVEL